MLLASEKKSLFRKSSNRLNQKVTTEDCARSLLLSQQDHNIKLQPSTFCPCGGWCPRCKDMANDNDFYQNQSKLKVSEPDDLLEREADRMAEQIITMPYQNSQFKNHVHSNKENAIHFRKKKFGKVLSNNSNKVMKGIENISSQDGKPLDSDTKEFMESRFGYDFSDVRIYDNVESHQLANSLKAQAFTFGNNIFLSSVESRLDKNLLAHELTHVIQQNYMPGDLSLIQRQPINKGLKNVTRRRASVSVLNWEDYYYEYFKIMRYYGVNLRSQEKVHTSGYKINSNAFKVALYLFKKKLSRLNIDFEKFLKNISFYHTEVGVPTEKEQGSLETTALPITQETVPETPTTAATVPETPTTAATVPETPTTAATVPETPTTAATVPETPTTAATVPETPTTAATVPETPTTAATVSETPTEVEPVSETTELETKESLISPEFDRGFQQVVKSIKLETKKQKTLPSVLEYEVPQIKTAISIGAIKKGKSEEIHLKEMFSNRPNFEQHKFRHKFRDDLLENIKKLDPKNLEKEKDISNKVKPMFSKEKIEGEDEMRKAVGEGPHPENVTKKGYKELEKPKKLPIETQLGIEKSIPKSKPESEYSLENEISSLDDLSTEVSDETFVKTGEPDFIDPVMKKDEAKKSARLVPTLYQDEEMRILSEAKEQAIMGTVTKLNNIGDERINRLKQTHKIKEGAVKTSEEKQKEVYENVNRIYSSKKALIDPILENLNDKAVELFSGRIKDATNQYKLYVQWKIEEDEESEEHIFAQAKIDYDYLIDIAIDEVTEMVKNALLTVYNHITDGLNEVEKYVGGLDTPFKEIGILAGHEIGDKFNGLAKSIDQKAEEIVENLTTKYIDNSKELEAFKEKIIEENKSLLSKAKDAIKGAVKAFAALKDMLLRVITKGIEVIGKIIEDPIGFFKNLVTGVKAGFDAFITNIGTHLQKGLIEWLFGEIREGGIQLPETFDAKGVLYLVIQIIGISYTKIRNKIVKRLGKENISEENLVKVEKMIEKGEKIAGGVQEGLTIFNILKKDGLVGLWDYIQDKLENIKDIVVGQIQSWLEKEVFKAGIKWILSLFNPVAAFIKAVLAIVDIVKFLVERMSQLERFLNSILDALSEIADGNIKLVATKVEDALAGAIPIVIGLLASMLGLGGLSTTIKAIIKGIQNKVDIAIDWVIEKIVGIVKWIGKKLGIGKQEEEEEKIPMTKHERSKEGHKKLAEIVARSKNAPFDAKTLQKELSNLKSTYEFKKLEIESLQNNLWLVVSSMSPEEEDYIVATGNYECNDIFNSYPPIMVQMTITNIKTKRQSSTTEKVRKPYRDIGLSVDGGHLIALFLGGPDNINNLVPMSSASNQKTYLHLFEKNIEDKFKNKSPLEVLCMRVHVKYPSENNFMNNLPFMDPAKKNADIEGLWKEKDNPHLTKEQKALINLLDANKDILMEFPDSITIELIFYDTVQGTTRQEEYLFDPRKDLGALRPVLQQLGITEKVRKII